MQARRARIESGCADETTVGRSGRYHAGVTAPGLYRVRYKGAAGPGVRIR